MPNKLNIAVVVGLVDRLTRPLKRLTQDVQKTAQLSANATLVGASLAAGGAALIAPLRSAVTEAGRFSSVMTDIGILAGVPAAQLAAVRPELMAIARASNQYTTDLADGLRNLTGAGMAFDKAMAVLPGIATATTAAKASMGDMAELANSLIKNLAIDPTTTGIGRTLDILIEAGNQGHFELRAMAQYLPGLTGLLKALGLEGEHAAATIGATLQVVREQTGDDAQAADYTKNLLSKLTAPATIDAMKKHWGLNLEQVVRGWTAQGLNVFDEFLKLIQARTGGDPFQVQKIFGDMEVMGALRPLLSGRDQYHRIYQTALGGAGQTGAAQFARRTSEDPLERWKRVGITFANIRDQLGTALLPLIERLSERLAVVSERVSAWITANPQLAKTLLVVGAVGGAAMLVFGGLITVLAGVLGSLGILVWSLGKLLAPFKGLWKLLGLIAIPLGRIATWSRGAAVGLTMMAATAGPLTGLAKTAGPLAKLAGVFRLLNLALKRSPLMLLVMALAGIGVSSMDWEKLTGKDGPLGGFVEKVTTWWKKTMDQLLGPDGQPRVPGAARAPLPDRLPEVLIGPQRTAAEAAAMAQRYGPSTAVKAAVQAATRPTSRTAWALLSGLLAPVVGTMPLASAAATSPRAPGPAITIPISITIQAPPGADAQRLADLVRREVQGAASQAGQRIAALYDGSDI